MLGLPPGRWSKPLFATVVVTAVVVLAFLAYIFATFQGNVMPGAPDGDDSHTIPTYLALFIFAEVYQVVVCWDALRNRNIIQLIGLCLFQCMMLVYAAIQYDQIRNVIADLFRSKYYSLNEWPVMKSLVIAIPCVLGASSLLLGFLTYKAYQEFGWAIYKYVGADISLRRKYVCFLIFITLLKYDFFFFLGFTIQFLVIVLNVKDVEFALTVVVIPVTIAILYLALVFVKRENRFAMGGIIVVLFAGLAYFLFKLVRMYQPSQEYKYVATRKTLTTFAVITIVLLCATIVNAFVCIANFGSGLREVIAKDSGGYEEEKYPLNDVGPRPRMTIE